MAVNMAAAMQACRNYFERGYRDGEFSLVGGILDPAIDAPYVYISGSAYHDGVHRQERGRLTDGEDTPSESFTGRVWALCPPASFTALVEEISAYDDKNPAGSLVSESFGAYSYNRGSGSGGGVKTWEEAFFFRLIPYRRMFTEVG